MLQPIDYALPTLGQATNEDQPLQRYFVYGLDEQTMRTARFVVHARGLTSLAYMLKAEHYMPEFIVVGPDKSVTEPPEFNVYVDEALTCGDAGLRSRMGAMARDGGGTRPNVLIPPVERPHEQGRRSLGADVLLRTPQGFTVVGTSGKLPGERLDTLARCGLWCGGVNAAFGAIVVLVLVTFARLDPATAGLLAMGTFIVYIVPGAAMLVMGLDQLKRQKWVPVTATILGSLLVLVIAIGLVTNATSNTLFTPLSLLFGIVLITTNGRYLAAAIVALMDP